ncbi:unnamed protein product [Linum trigynum]|uniref:Uncharacterized protein n=1 Tax=Linum trigynum TaxID=586398 RepID=A0AAV2F616_9ROSI
MSSTTKPLAPSSERRNRTEEKQRHRWPPMHGARQGLAAAGQWRSTQKDSDMCTLLIVRSSGRRWFGKQAPTAGTHRTMIDVTGSMMMVASFDHIPARRIG